MNIQPVSYVAMEWWCASPWSCNSTKTKIRLSKEEIELLPNIENDPRLESLFKKCAHHFIQEAKEIKKKSFLGRNIQPIVFFISQMMVNVAIRLLIAPLGMIYHAFRISVYGMQYLYYRHGSESRLPIYEKMINHQTAFVGDLIYFISGLILLLANNGQEFLGSPASNPSLNLELRVAFMLRAHFGFVSPDSSLLTKHLSQFTKFCKNQEKAYDVLAFIDKQVFGQLVNLVLPALNVKQLNALIEKFIGKNEEAAQRKDVIKFLKQQTTLFTQEFKEFLEILDLHLKLAEEIKNLVISASFWEGAFNPFITYIVCHNLWVQWVMLKREEETRNLTSDKNTTNASYNSFKQKILEGESLYNILGLESMYATKQEIEKACKQLAPHLHPDKHSGKSTHKESAFLFQMLNKLKTIAIHQLPLSIEQSEPPPPFCRLIEASPTSIS